ncbi:MAG TPA: VanZ family protein [Geothermobacteraceae bacterium]|nr:VanZ family protein [Geothermobacteraceae bacterium]
MLTILKQLQFWALLLACLALSLMPQPPGVFELASDKFWHALAYLVLYLSSQIAYPMKVSQTARFTLLLGFSLLIEILQHFVPRREFSLLDLAANAAGLLLGMLAYRLSARITR